MATSSDALRLRVASQRGASNALVDVGAPGEIVGATINGEEIDRAGVPERLRDQMTFSYAGVPEEGFVLSLRIQSAGTVILTGQDVTEGLPRVPGLQIQPRPS